MTAHPDVGLEQAYLDEAERCLEAMRARTEAAIAVADNAAQEVDAEIARAHLRYRRRAMDVGGGALAFGRIDEETGDRWHVGRRHVEDAAGNPVVVDWRAPVAIPFYRATAADPFGLSMRRRFLLEGPTLVDLYDEVFDDPDSVHAAMHGGIPDPLLAELERERTGAMRDIVATIQAEQDVVIRAPLEQCLIVQGGPGTGKTAVGLHRAAFLLFEHRELLDAEGVLVLGPNPVFLRYIGQVLPSLGETAVRQATLDQLLGGRVRAFDAAATAALKGDARMATVIARAVDALVKPLTEDFEAATAWGTVRVPVADLRSVVDEIRGRGVPHNVGRNALRTQLVRLCEQRIASRFADDVVVPLGFADDLRATKAYQRAINGWWPTASAPALVRRLLSSRTTLARAAEGVLTADEQARLLRKATKRADDEPWTAADLVLVDEAEARIDGVRRTYGHIVVDEAQDLTAMELRVIGRRAPRSSMTILGDLAQSTRAGAQQSWLDALGHLGAPAGAELTELELGYRVPAPILDFANRLLPIAAPDVRPSRSVRTAGREPVVVHDPELRVGPIVAALVEAWTTVGVVLPEDLGLGADIERRDGVLVVSPPEAKGLEFDAVVVVEPAAFAVDERDGSGLRLLYIALTRAVQVLTIVHARPLPAVLRA